MQISGHASFDSMTRLPASTSWSIRPGLEPKHVFVVVCLISKPFFVKYDTDFFLVAEQSLKVTTVYEVSLTRSWLTESIKMETRTVGVQEWLRDQFVRFNYILFRGLYEVSFRLCELNDVGDSICQFDNETVNSAKIAVNESHPSLAKSWCILEQDEKEAYLLEKYSPVIVSNDKINFSFAFTPCHKILPYEEVDVSVYKSTAVANSSCGGESSLKILKSRVAIEAAHVHRKNNNNNSSVGNKVEAVIAYQVGIFLLIMHRQYTA